MGLETGIWASRLGFEGGGTEKKEKKEEEEKEKKEKISHMCESIGHRPLRGRCPKMITSNKWTDQATDRKTSQPPNQSRVCE